MYRTKKTGRDSPGFFINWLCNYQHLGAVNTLTGVQGTAAVT